MCTLILTCFPHTVKQAICHLELIGISKTATASSKRTKNFQRDYNIHFLNVNYDNLRGLQRRHIASFTFWLLSFTLANSDGCPNKLLLRNGVVGVCKVQMLASNTSKSTIVHTSGNKSSKGFRPLATFKKPTHSNK